MIDGMLVFYSILIPLALGAGYLLYYLFENLDNYLRKNDEKN